jgi:hypothetical protein
VRPSISEYRIFKPITARYASALSARFTTSDQSEFEDADDIEAAVGASPSIH